MTKTPEPARPSAGEALDRVNDSFHEAYEGTRGVKEREPPILVVIADALVFFRGGERRELPFSPRAFHVVKSVAHAPLALYAALARTHEATLDEPARGRIAALRKQLEASLDLKPYTELDAELTRELRLVLARTLALAERCLSSERLAGETLDAFARELGPRLLQLTDHATRMQLAALHACVTTLVAPLTPEERRELQVVVTGDHQARARSLGMQYFRKLLREPEGAEERVTYAEGVSDENEARALVGTRRFDRQIASAFFGDEKRLQRDVLGDATAARLRELDLPPFI